MIFGVAANVLAHHAILSGIYSVGVVGSSSSARKRSFSSAPTGAARRRRARPLPDNSSPSSASSNGIHVASNQANRLSPRLRGIRPSPGLRDQTDHRNDLLPVFSAPDKSPSPLSDENSEYHSDSQSRVLIGETQVAPSQEQGQPQEQLVAGSNEEVPASLPPATLRNTDDNGSAYSSPSSVSDEDAVPTNNIEEEFPTEENHPGQEGDECDSSDSDFSSSLPVHDKIMHYLKGRTVSHKNREAVKNAIVAAAGLHTMEYERGTTEQRNTIVLERYKAIVQSFHPNDFQGSDIGLKNIMMDRLKHAQGPVTGEKLWNKFNTIRKELRIMHTKIKTAPRDIPSGKQLNQVYKEWIAEQYKQNKVSNVCVSVSVNSFLTVMLIQIFHRLQNLTMFP